MQPKPAFTNGRNYVFGFLLWGLWLFSFTGSTETQPMESRSIDVTEQLARAHQISFGQSWQDAQEILDHLAPEVETFELREFAEFHLLEARHLSLADRSKEALTRMEMLLELPLDDDQRLRALQFSANVAVLLRDYELAYSQLRGALGLAESVDDPTASMATYGMAAYMFGRVGAHERAIEYGQLGVQLARDTGETNQVCRAMQRVVPVYKWAGQKDDAETGYRTAIDYCQRAGNRLFVGVLRHGLADMLRTENRFDEALELAEAAVDDLAAAGFILGLNEAKLVLAETQVSVGTIDESLRGLVAEVYGYFNGRELFDQLARVERLNAYIAAEADDAPGVLAAFERRLAAHEHFLNRDRAMLMGYLQVEFDLDLKARQISALEESAHIAQLEIESVAQQQQLRTIILLLSIALLGLLSIVLWRVLRGRRYFQYLARYDRLSGLANHAWFFECAEAQIKYPMAPEEPVWLVTADIDHFKRINDHYGHLVGDQVLAQTARRLQDAFGEKVLIGRIGGEEFGILISGPAPDVIAAIERFRDSNLQTIEGEPQIVSLSFGVAQVTHEDSLERLRDRADKAMYKAKRAGRDCYVIAE